MEFTKKNNVEVEYKYTLFYEDAYITDYELLAQPNNSMKRNRFRFKTNLVNLTVLHKIIYMYMYNLNRTYDHTLIIQYILHDTTSI